ncbi:MAG: Crp/Fnr family transcriptional regulator [Chitinophagales bacterium]
MPVALKIHSLEQINFLNGLSTATQESIIPLLEKHNLPKGSRLYRSGELANLVFFLVEGRIKVGTYSEEGKEIIKTIVYPGEMFGELGLAGETLHANFARAMNEKVTFYTMRVEDALFLMSNNSELSFKVMTHIGSRLRGTERRLESLIFNDARTRIVDFLKDTAKKRGIKVGYEILIKKCLTHQEIANITATSRQTVTIVLNELKKQDLIYIYNRNNILIRDIKALK